MGLRTEVAEEVGFLWVVVLAFDEELEFSHQAREFRAFPQDDREGRGRVCGLAVADLRLAKDDHDGVVFVDPWLVQGGIETPVDDVHVEA